MKNIFVLLIILINIPIFCQQISIVTFDELYIAIICNGDVFCRIASDVESPLASIPYVLGLKDNLFSVRYTVGSNVTTGGIIDLTIISDAEADVEISKVVDYAKTWLGINFKLEEKRVHEFRSQATGQLFRYAYYTFIAEDFNPDMILDKFLALIPNEGLMSLVNRKIAYGGNFILNIYTTTNTCRLQFSKNFSNYYNFKIGETYVLDVFKLFNYTVPLKVHKMSDHSTQVSIELLQYSSPYIGQVRESNLQAQIINIELPFEYRVSTGRYANLPLPPIYTISNLIPTPPTGMPKCSLTAGDTIDYMRVTFKIVEYGYTSFQIDLPFIIGLIIIALTTLTITLLFRAKNIKKKV